MAEITLKGRTIPLLYTMLEMKQIQEEVAPAGEFLYLMLGVNKDDPEDRSPYGSPEHLNALAKAIRILGNAGLEEDGQEPDLTDKWVMRSLRPAKIQDAMRMCLDAFNEGMASEIPVKKSNEPVDVTLEQIERKKKTDS